MKNQTFTEELKTQNDTVLLQLMAGNDEVLRNKAFTCFYDRYVTNLNSLCKRVCQQYNKYLNSDLADVVMHNTFIEVYQHPAKVLKRLEQELKATGKNLKVAVLLSAMAGVELRNELRGEEIKYARKRVSVTGEKELNKMVLMNDFFWDEEKVTEDELLKIDNAKKEDLITLEEAGKKLKPIKKEVLEFIKQHDLPNRYLLKEEKTKFLARTGLTDVNLRKLKERLIKELRQDVLKGRKAD